jgi:outer membrane biosynthesis protein TonB
VTKTGLLGLLSVSIACAANRAPVSPPQFTAESHPDVQSAVHGIPAGGTPPRKLHDVNPSPSQRYGPGTHLQVLLEGVITPGGDVRVVSVARSDDAAFAHECARAALQWRYEPARAADGSPIALWTKFACSLTIR